MKRFLRKVSKGKEALKGGIDAIKESVEDALDTEVTYDEVEAILRKEVAAGCKVFIEFEDEIEGPGEEQIEQVVEHALSLLRANWIGDKE